jgi:hypothetical protein
MKQLLIFFLLIALNVKAEDYVKESRDYAGFGGVEKDMREEIIYKVEAGKKIKVGSKISKIKPYELRELEIGGKYWLKDDPATNDIKDQFDSLIDLSQSTTKKAELSDPHALGAYGGNGPMPAMGIGFCTPNSDESECAAPDGRVYKLDKSTNQLGRNINKEKEIDHVTTKPNSASTTSK